MPNYSKLPVAVLIPVYKATIEKSEYTSLRQCLNILKLHPILLIAPEGLKLDIYHEVFAQSSVDFQVVFFDKKYFKNIAGYNRLMLSDFFYKKFLIYRFILIYQLDAYVFKNELLKWCNENYDYIGAPHLPYANTPGRAFYFNKYGKFLNFVNAFLRINHKISNVGNGGFSLRKTRTFFLLLSLLKKKAQHWDHNEDGFFKYWGNLLYPIFKLPTDDTALHFAIESEPKKALERLNYQLPFGCHAFEKFDRDTWAPYINNV